MAMFDWYRPALPLRCPFDGHPLETWQGKDGPRLLLVWQEGVKHPADDRVDEEVRYSASDLEAFILPPTFAIYSYDCPVHRPILATCTAPDGIWCSTEIRRLPSERDDHLWFAATRPTDTVTSGGAPPKLREFTLVDLTTQMPYLPTFIRTWPRDRLLAWLSVWGEVHKLEGTPGAEGADTYTFQSWVGRWTPFVLTQDGRMFIPATPIRAWPELRQ